MSESQILNVNFCQDSAKSLTTQIDTCLNPSKSDNESCSCFSSLTKNTANLVNVGNCSLTEEMILAKTVKNYCTTGEIYWTLNHFFYFYVILNFILNYELTSSGKGSCSQLKLKLKMSQSSIGFHTVQCTPTTHPNFSQQFLSSLWSDLSMWGHFLIVLNLRNQNLRSVCATERGNAH